MKYLQLILILIVGTATAQTPASYTPWYAQNGQSMYRNLEKYWWYRYRLVNDFMKTGTGCGESIPMERWEFTCGKGPECENKAYWGDATQHLGNYINVLAGEWFLLNHSTGQTRRTEEELYDALYAFERLDEKAEPSWRDYDHYYPGCGQMDLPQGTGNSGDINGFFIRDDVPSLQLPPNYVTGFPGMDNFITANSAHFHRPGFFYNTPNVIIQGDFGPDANIQYGGVTVHSQECGTPYPYARGPGEVSQDQIVQLYGGLGMAGFGHTLTSGLTYNGWNLGEQARLQLYRIFDFAGMHGCSSSPAYTICNPIDNQCVGIPRGNPCNKGGGQILFNAVGAVNGLSHIGLPSLSGTGLYPYGRLWNAANSPAWGWLYQAQQWASVTTPFAGSIKDLYYSNVYANFADDWRVGLRLWLGPWTISLRFINTTEKKINKHATADKWAWPHLPLMYQIINGRGAGSGLKMNPSNYGVISYEEMFDDAPFCGCHNYDANSPSFRSSIPHVSYGDDEDFIGQDGWYWSTANRLQDEYKRGLVRDNSDYNNLDYMTVWNLYAEVEGSGAIPLMMNPYYNENYNKNMPLSNGYGQKG
ncbi:MAG: hypothetical protein JST06_09435 [Bacteroidetes bacterium]|nr:hypothetical protein [Bacteroidota bacterium]